METMLLHLHLVRHGQTFFNRYNRLQGWSNSPLTDAGLADADKAAAKADKAQAKIPKKQVRQKTVDPETGKVTTKLVLEDKKKPPSKLSHAVRDTPANAALGKLHNL